jgi:hypothetical protein
LFENNMRDERNRGWVSGLVPLHQAILERQVGESRIFFVVGVFQYAVQVWPIKRIGDHNFAIDWSADSRPEWRFFFNVDQLSVVPFEARSPLRVAAEYTDVALADSQIICSHAEPQPLMTWQAHHGFANVNEFTLKKAHVFLKLPPSSRMTPRSWTLRRRSRWHA